MVEDKDYKAGYVQGMNDADLISRNMLSGKELKAIKALFALADSFYADKTGKYSVTWLNGYRDGFKIMKP